MFEGQRVVTGQVLVNEALAPARTDEDALEVAVRQHARLVYRIAYSVLRNHHDAEDVTQETFLRVLRYRRKLSGIEDPRTWLARIAWRVAIERQKNERRKREKTPDVSLEELAPVMELKAEGTSADESVLQKQVSGLLQGFIAALPAKLRDPLVLSTLEEMSIADVARVLDLSEAAVRSRIFRAREILKEKLAARLEQP